MASPRTCITSRATVSHARKRSGGFLLGRWSAQGQASGSNIAKWAEKCWPTWLERQQEHSCYVLEGWSLGVVRSLIPSLEGWCEVVKNVEMHDRDHDDHDAEDPIMLVAR